MNHYDNVEIAKIQFEEVMGYEIGRKGSDKGVDFSATLIVPSANNQFVVVVDNPNVNEYELTRDILKLKEWAEGRKPRNGVGWKVTLVVMGCVSLSDQFADFWRKEGVTIIDTKTNMIPGFPGDACHDVLIVYPEREPKLKRPEEIHDMKYDEPCCEGIHVPNFPERNPYILYNLIFQHKTLSSEQIFCFNLKMACHHALRCARQEQNNIVHVVWEHNPPTVPIYNNDELSRTKINDADHECWGKFKNCMKKHGWTMVHPKMKGPGVYSFVKKDMY